MIKLKIIIVSERVVVPHLLAILQLLLVPFSSSFYPHGSEQEAPTSSFPFHPFVDPTQIRTLRCRLQNNIS
jgi:hypothetical protein